MPWQPQLLPRLRLTGAWRVAMGHRASSSRITCEDGRRSNGADGGLRCLLGWISCPIGLPLIRRHRIGSRPAALLQVPSQWLQGWRRCSRYPPARFHTRSGLSGVTQQSLVLQLRIMRPVVSLGGAELMALPPGGPSQDEWRSQRWPQQRLGNETANFWHAGQAEADRGQAASAGLVLFGLQLVSDASDCPP
jgi:hypothetical protein